jgi:hypothetical protein
MNSSTLGFPDFSKFKRSGESGRILEPLKQLESPKLFCPVILRIQVTLDAVRNHVELMDVELEQVIKGYMGLDETIIIDVWKVETSSEDVSFVEVTLSEMPVPPVVVGTKGVSRIHNVQLTVVKVEDTVEDDFDERRNEIVSLLSESTQLDGVVLSIPQHWLIPDPEFRPKTTVLPVYPSSAWLLFFKNIFGQVTGSSIVFKDKTSNLHGMVGLAVKFKEHKSLRQCMMFLHRRYLIHPKEGLGMKITNIRPVNYDLIISDATGGVTSGVSGRAKRVAALGSHNIEDTAKSIAQGSSDQVGEIVADAFRLMLEKLEKLEAENQRLVDMLAVKHMEDQIEDEEEQQIHGKRERSPRSSGIEMIPTTGMPKWKR